MRTLTLMRHAKSSWDDVSLSDHERPLNKRGEMAAITMAKRLKASGYEPSLVIVSSARRTQQTAEVLQEVHGGALNMMTEPALYEAGPEVYKRVIRRVEEGVNHLMMIGHNPTMEWLASELSGRNVTMPTAAYMRFEIDSAWRLFDLRPYRVIDYDFPKSRK